MKKLLLLFFFCLLTAFDINASEKPLMLFFYSDDCEHCKRVREEFLPDFLKKYGKSIEFVSLEVSTQSNIDSLYAMESRVKFPEEDKDYPAVYFMGSILESEVKIRLGLEQLVKSCLANPDSALAVHKEVMARIPEEFPKSEVRGAKIIHVAYFYKTGCKKCSRVEEIINWLKGIYSNIKIEKFDIADRNSKIISAALGAKTGVPKEKLMSTPMIFFGGDEYLLSGEITRNNLSALITKYSKSGTIDVWNKLSPDELKDAELLIRNEFRSFVILAVALAGLGDGINPCAFATILFFVSYLTMVGRKRNEILLVGLSFAFSVFLTYFLVGMGFFGFIKSMTNIALLSKIIFGSTAFICLVFGILSIGDYFKARKGNVSEMTLQLPSFLKKRIHSVIRENVRTKSIVFGALGAGFMVSILEFACTGQVYLPTITFMVGMEGQRSTALLYLLIYNICFIIPLLIVFGIVYFGVSSQKISHLMETNVGTVKLVLAFVFFAVGGLLFWAVFI